jgi:hypothetical protein
MTGSYSFLAWARQGLANRITGAGTLRASMPVQLKLGVHQLDGSDVERALPPRTVELYGPSDILGLDSRAIIRTEPRAFITNFEPNYLAAIEFYDEDLPWRYTPAAPDGAGARLTPWLALIVLKEGEEFSEGGDKDRPLPYITLKNNAQDNAFPDAQNPWAWAHVHVNRGLTANDAEIVATNRDVVAQRLAATVGENADLAYSRLVCPRKLEPSTAYQAFVVPAFESGRLAGLGLDPTQAPNATALSWTSNGAEKDSFPVYFRWQFRTGIVGDFEYLVRLLQPKPVDIRVGARDMDVQQPGANVPGITDPALQGMLQLGGALRVPRLSLTPEQRAQDERRENWAQPYPHPFQTNLAALVNLADSYSSQSAAVANSATGLPGVSGSDDPVIVPPLYGRWHARTSRLLKDSAGNPAAHADNWVHQLNLDPRYRVPAGFGTQVVQARQEDLMAAAWDQVGAVLEANRRIRAFQFSLQVALTWHVSDFKALADVSSGKMISLTGPVHSRVMTTAVSRSGAARGTAPGNNSVTMKAKVRGSLVPPAVISPTFRRLTRARGSLAKAVAVDRPLPSAHIVERLNEGEVIPAPPKVTPPGVVTVGAAAASTLPSGIPAWLVALLRRSPWIVYLPVVLAIILALLLLLIGLGFVAAVAVAVAGVVLTGVLLRIRNSVNAADALLESNQTPDAVSKLSNSPDFTFTEGDAAPPPITLSRGGTDSPQAVKFKAALADAAVLVQSGMRADPVGENGPVRDALSLASEAKNMLTALDPVTTLPKRAAGVVRIPPRIRAELPETFVEAMAYPVFDIPMYRPLADLSAELLIPNINLVETNSITLLETNQRFIEAYMVGLNHEFARELLWREYPTDQRGSYFRQFWDVSSFFAGANANDADLRERLRDIPPLHRWSLNSKLGDHDARERPGDSEEELVLVIRGELLKRYPNAVIYAQAADWARKPNGDIDLTKERSLVALTASEEDNPPRDKLRTPLYTCKLEPDIYFMGFDLTALAARGGDGKNSNDPPGWFFVIRERPGEPRFGFDVESSANIVVWNDLGWDRVPMAGGCIRPVPVAGQEIQIPTAIPAGEEEKTEQWTEDKQVPWRQDVSAAELAYVLYQAPAMVAVHAAELLPAI